MKTKKSLVFFLVILVLMQSFAMFSMAEDAEKNEEAETFALGEYIVMPALLNFRKEPNLETEVLEVLTQGTKLNIEKIEDGWGFANYQDKSGWLMIEYLEYIGYLEKYSVDWNMISVSQNHGNIDWAEVAENDIDAVLAQIAYSDKKTGEIIKDENFQSNYNAVLISRMHMGPVFVSSALDTDKSLSEAKWLVDEFIANKLMFDMPIFIDVRALQGSNLDKDACTNLVITFCDYLLENSYYPGLILNSKMIDKELDMQKLSKYALCVEEIGGLLSYKGRVNAWSYTNNQKFDGIEKTVSFGPCYTNFPKLIADNSYNNVEFIGEHILGEWEVLTPSTCTGHGKRVKNCIKCGIILKSQILPLKNHNFDQWEIIKESTEKEEGEIVFKCSDCGEIVRKQYTAALNPTHFHWPGDWIETNAPDCSNSGEKAIKCTICDKILFTEILQPAKHEAGDWLIDEPSCILSGKRVLYCKNCNIQMEFGLIPALGHDVREWTIEKAATITETGLRSGKCEVCEEIITEEIPKLIPSLKGDVNFDGKVTAADARLILRFSASLEVFTDEQKIIADMNNDDRVNAADARLALRKSARLD